MRLDHLHIGQFLFHLLVQLLPIRAQRWHYHTLHILLRTAQLRQRHGSFLLITLGCSSGFDLSRLGGVTQSKVSFAFLGFGFVGG